MNRYLKLIGMLILAIAIVGCNQTEDQEQNQDQEQDQNQDQEQDQNQDQEGTTGSEFDDEAVEDDSSDTAGLDEMTKQMEKLGYSDFELEVKYEDDIEYEAELKQGNNSIEADLEDEMNDVDIKGEEAFDKLFQLVEQLTIEQNTEKEEAISEILDVFDLDDNYKEFELEITFNDGVKLEYEDRD